MTATSETILRLGLMCLIATLLTEGAGDQELRHKEKKAGLVRKYLRKHRKHEGAVKLADGRGAYEGNVEVFHQGKWGSVCDDEWDVREGLVACRQLGYQGMERVTHSSMFGMARRQYLMDNLFCTGEEKQLTDCKFDGWGHNDCSASEAAGVICTSPETASTTPQPSTDSPKRQLLRIKDVQTEDMRIRLRGGRVPEEGRVEIQFGNSTEWGLVCGDGWDIFDAMVVCRQLGLGYANDAIQTDFFGGNASDMILSGLHCNGNETTLSHCLHDQLGRVLCPGRRENIAGVVCTSSKSRQSPGQRLGNVESHLTQLGRELCPGRRENIAGVVCTSSKSRQSPGQRLGDVESHLTQLGRELCPGRRENIAGVVCTSMMADLIIDHHEIMRTAHLEDKQLFFLQCAMEENCLASQAYKMQTENLANWHLETRRLLRFTASIINAGTADFRPVVPKHLWEFHQCHMHYHSMEVFATFDILDGRGVKVAEGHKASFCLEDNKCLPGVNPRYVCANFGDQGISVNCTDVYQHSLDCQWVDISELDPGLYTFKVSVNPEFKIAEMSFDNNAAVCQLLYTESFAQVFNCSSQRP